MLNIEQIDFNELKIYCVQDYYFLSESPCGA